MLRRKLRREAEQRRRQLEGEAAVVREEAAEVGRRVSEAEELVKGLRWRLMGLQEAVDMREREFGARVAVVAGELGALEEGVQVRCRV